MCRVGVRRGPFRRMSVDQRVEPLRISAALVEKRCAIDADNIHDEHCD
jgi:hypothetical protein